MSVLAGGGSEGTVTERGNDRWKRTSKAGESLKRSCSSRRDGSKEPSGLSDDAADVAEDWLQRVMASGSGRAVRE